MLSGITQKTLRIGTRGSKLALEQTRLVRDALLPVWPDIEVVIETITTRGDEVQDKPLSQVGGNGVFVRKIEQALSDSVIDAAVHSAKDLPAALAPGMVVAAYLPRADARDVLISRNGEHLVDLPPGARVGSSSPRRACQLRAIRPDLQLLDIRGNVDTRLRKLREGQYDAIVLAAAGLERLGLLEEVSEWLDPERAIPAVGQGALAVEARAGDTGTLGLLARIDDPATRQAVSAERAFLARLGGSCALPVAAHAVLSQGTISITGMIGSGDGRVVTGNRTGPTTEPAQLGDALAEDLLSRGGLELVEASIEAQR